MLEQKANILDDLIGIPFEHGKMDCWALSIEVFNRYGINIPYYNIARQTVSDVYDAKCVSNVMEEKALNWIEIEKPIVPCIVALSLGVPGFINHVGVYIGDSKFIHTTRMRGAVTIERIDNPLFRNKKFYRYDSNSSH